MTQCTQCQGDNPDDSAFCRHCGQALLPGDEQELLGCTRPLALDAKSLTAASNAIATFLQRFGDRPAALEVQFTQIALVRSMRALNAFTNARFEQLDPIDAWSYADSADQLPDVLGNGLVTHMRIARPDQRADTERALRLYADLAGSGLSRLFDDAERELASLLVDGEARSVVERVTMEQAYDRAEEHFQALKRGDIDSAREGFEGLKQLNPYDAYFRGTLAVVYSKMGRHTDSLRENLFGIHLDPHRPSLRSNLLRDLCKLCAFPSALEAYVTLSRNATHPEATGFEEYGQLARIATALMLSQGLAPGDYSSTAPDLADEFEPAARPWMQPLQQDAYVRQRETRIVLSYRRSGASTLAGQIKRELELRFPRMKVFQDVADNVAATDWTQAIRDEIRRANVVLVLIDKDWTRNGGIMTVQDVVRREVETAFESFRAILPVLLNGADMPAIEELPSSLKRLTTLHAVGLNESRFRSEFPYLVQDLVDLLEREAASSRKTQQDLESIEQRLATGEDLSSKADTSHLPRFVPARQVNDEGVQEVRYEGHWEARAASLHGVIELQFQLASDQQFDGQLILPGKSAQQIHGSGYPVLDAGDHQTNPIHLGVQLSGLVVTSGEPLNIRIPFHRRVGDYYQGTDENDMVWHSRNLKPAAF